MCVICPNEAGMMVANEGGRNSEERTEIELELFVTPAHELWKKDRTWPGVPRLKHVELQNNM